ncbi:MAG: hypothetical protein KAV97_03985 [Actinomycetia bacterium]|nr:hypothetical protein [Actinomycetes bacterium]
MSININNYTFDGPYSSTDKIEDSSGIYAIICKKSDKNYIIDVGESAKVKYRVENHDRKDCWNKNCREKLTVAVYYTPNLHQSGRMEIEQEIRNKYDIPCGKV